MSRFISREDSAHWARFEMGAVGEDRAAPKPRPAAGGPEPAREAIERAAREQGYAAGFAEGRTAAARISALAAGLESAAERFEDQYAAQVLDLALELARQMVRAELAVRRESLVAVVREALRALPDGARRPQIVVHPADVELLREPLGEDLARGAWTLIEDHRIEPGGCRLESASGDVDATLASRWERLAESLGRESTWDPE